MILTSILLTSAATALLANLHCTAMCGPLVASCHREPRLSRSTALYVGGRLISYAFVGTVMGKLGEHAGCILPVRNIQLFATAAVALWALWKGVSAFRSVQTTTHFISLKRKETRNITQWIAQWIPKQALGLGLATGFLPCGVLATAWTLAASTAKPLHGAAVMAVFSICSLPGLLAAIVGKRIIQNFYQRLPRYAQGLAWCSLAIWIIARPFIQTYHCAH